MSAKKAVQDTDIPVKVLKENAEFFADQICRQLNEDICSSKFPAAFKFVDVTPVFKQDTGNPKDNYRPISILLVISKIFEKLICKQLSNHFNNIFSKFQCGFRKGLNAQHYLLLMIGKWKKAVDDNKAFGALLTDLSKAFDCICHGLLVAKLHAYGVALLALKMIQDYLLNQKQRTKVGSFYSTWENIISGVAQGTILGPLLFKIFLCDLFLEHKDCCFTNYADATTPYVVANNTAEEIENLIIITQKLFTWFPSNQMKVNHDKCHLLLRTQDEANIQIAITTIKCSKLKKLLGIVLDNKLKFYRHVENICQKASKTLNALAKMTNYMELPKRRILTKAFFKAQFNYSPTVWRFHNRSLNNKINRLHERCLRIIYKNKHSNFEELLVNDNSVSIHHNNIHTLATEMYKVANSMSPEIMNEILKLRENIHYSLRQFHNFLLIQFTVCLMVVNQYRIWDPKCENKYPSKLKIFTSLLGLKKN